MELSFLSSLNPILPVQDLRLGCPGGDMKSVKFMYDEYYTCEKEFRRVRT
jgi:hypothetical protein